MSTKIYDVYKYNDNLYSLLEKLKVIRKEYQEEKLELLSHFGNIEVEVEDGRKVLLKDLHKEALGDMFFGDYLEKRMKIGYNEPMNISASAVIYPYKDDLFVHFFGISSKVIKTIKGLSDYHYQNQTDQSNYDWEKESWDDMTDERQKELEDDWDERCKVWDDILGDDTPSESGFLFEFQPSGYNMSVFCREITQKIKERNENQKEEGQSI